MNTGPLPHYVLYFKQGLSADFIDILIKKFLLQQHWGVEYLKRFDNVLSNQSFSFMFFKLTLVYLIYYLSRILVYAIIYQLSLFRNSESCNSINVFFFLSKEKMLAMLSLLRKMTTFIITSINNLYLKVITI